MDKLEADVAKALDAVVGDRYRPPRRAGPTLARWLAAAIAALGAVAVIVWILHRHLTDAQTAPAPKRPVPVTIIPSPG
jgi:hypothetical protein